MSSFIALTGFFVYTSCYWCSYSYCTEVSWGSGVFIKLVETRAASNKLAVWRLCLDRVIVLREEAAAWREGISLEPRVESVFSGAIFLPLANCLVLFWLHP